MTMKSVAVIGAGNWGKNLVSNFHELGVLTHVVEPNEDLRGAIIEKYPEITVLSEHHSLIESDVSAVAIATPAPTHFDIAKSFLSSGKDVFVEKPMTLSSTEALALCELADEKDRILMVGHLLLYQPAIQFIKEFIDSGKLGQIYHLHQERMKLGRARRVENVAWSLGVHDLAVLIYLIDKPVEGVAVSGHCGLQSTIEDDIYVHLTFKSGTKAHLHSSWLWPVNRRQLTVVGEKGMLVFDEISGQVWLHQKSIDKNLSNVDEGAEIIFEGSEKPLLAELSHFLDCVNNRSTPISDGRNGYSVVKVLEELTQNPAEE